MRTNQNWEPPSLYYSIFRWQWKVYVTGFATLLTNKLYFLLYFHKKYIVKPKMDTGSSKITSQPEYFKFVKNSEKKWKSSVSSDSRKLSISFSSPVIFFLQIYVLFSASIVKQLSYFVSCFAATLGIIKIRTNSKGSKGIPCHNLRVLVDPLNSKYVVLKKNFEERDLCSIFGIHWCTP